MLVKRGAEIYGDHTDRSFDLLPAHFANLNITFSLFNNRPLTQAIISFHVSAAYATTAEQFSWKFRKTSSFEVTSNFF